MKTAAETREALKRIAALPLHPCDDSRNAAALEIAIKVARSALQAENRGEA